MEGYRSQRSDTFRGVGDPRSLGVSKRRISLGVIKFPSRIPMRRNWNATLQF